VNLLPELFKTGLDEIVELKFSPYGNAHIRSNNTITCQHGPWECLLNTVEACAIDAWPALSEYFPFLYCVESLIYEHKQEQWETCFEKLNLDSKPVTDCVKSGYGNELELKYAAEIKALQPPHTYVPWVTVDGQPLYDDYYNFLPFICKAYKGANVPQACSNLAPNRIPTRKERANPIRPVCYKEETTKSLNSEADMVASV
jgi:interferon gamma-inducible protein 30